MLNKFTINKAISKCRDSFRVSIEDKKFYKHNGVDYKAILRAVKAIIEDGKLSQGGSTITMQLARNIYLDTDKNWRRKVKEMFIAVELEKRYRKEKIMEFYLNNIYFANGYYGVGAACHGYFDKELNELSLSEIAFLCAIPNSPTYYDPLVSPENTIERRDKILRNMLEDQLITQEEYDEAIAEEIAASNWESNAVLTLVWGTAIDSESTRRHYNYIKNKKYKKKNPYQIPLYVFEVEYDTPRVGVLIDSLKEKYPLVAPLTEEGEE